MRPLLAVAGSALGANQVPSMVEFADSELKLTGISLSNDELNNVNQRLRGDGFEARTQGQQLFIRAVEERRP